MKKRIISLLCCFTMIISILPLSVYAQENSIEKTFTENFNGKNYTVQEGYYYCNGTYLPYFYSDGYFEGSSVDYNIHCATMSLNMAIESMYDTSLPLKYRHSPLRQLLCEIGCDEDSILVNDSSLKESERFSIAFSMGNKKLAYSDGKETGYTLIPVIVRGGGYGHEWYSNANFGSEGEFYGFSIAADEIFNAVKDYIKDNNLTDKPLKFWVTGYSRGAAVSNLVAKRLIDAFSTESVYAYTYESPLCGNESEKLNDRSYNCIHNLVNYADFFTYAAPSEMGFIRYGQDHVFPFTDNSCTEYASLESDYNNRKVKMLEQYAMLGSSLDSNFDILDIYSFDQKLEDLGIKEIVELITKFVQISSSEKDITTSLLEQNLINKHSYNASRDGNYNKLTGDYMKTLLHQAQIWGLTSNDPNNTDINYRQQYASYESYLSGGTNCNQNLGTHAYIQDVASQFLDIFLNKSSKQLETLGKRAETVIDDYKIDEENINFNFISDKWDLYGPIFNMVLNWNKPEREKTPIVVYHGILNSYTQLAAPAINDTVRLQYISEFYNKFFNAIALQDGDDYLTESEMEELKQEWATAFNFALSIISADYNTTANNYGFAAGDNGRTVMLSTLLFNMNALSVNHEPNTTLAWLRSYDSYYNSEINPRYDIATSASAPTASVNDVTLSTNLSTPSEVCLDETIALDTQSTCGETIYYTVKNISTGTTIVENKLYAGKFKLPTSNNINDVYQITANAWSYGNLSPTATYYAQNSLSYCFSTVSLETNKISYKLKINSGICEPPIIFAAAYDGDKMMNIAVSTTSQFSNGYYEGSLEINTKKTYTYRLFVTAQNRISILGRSWSSNIQ